MLNMCIYKGENKKSQKENNKSLNNMSLEIQGVLCKAKSDQRLISGLSSAVSHLEKDPEDVLLCFLPGVRPGDSATHMQTVLLQAFCYENYIPVIQVDSSKRLAEMCGIKDSVKRCSEFFCAVIVRGENRSYKEEEDPPLSSSEKALIDFYEYNLNFYPQPVINLLPPVS